MRYYTVKRHKFFLKGDSSSDQGGSNSFTIKRPIPNYQLSRIVRKPDFCIFENKAADQLCGNHTADQRLCLHYIDMFSQYLSLLNSKFQASAQLLWLYSLVCVGLGRNTWRSIFSVATKNQFWAILDFQKTMCLQITMFLNIKLQIWACHPFTFQKS